MWHVRRTVYIMCTQKVDNLSESVYSIYCNGIRDYCATFSSSMITLRGHALLRVCGLLTMMMMCVCARECVLLTGGVSPHLSLSLLGRFPTCSVSTAGN